MADLELVRGAIEGVGRFPITIGRVKLVEVCSFEIVGDDHCQDRRIGIGEAGSKGEGNSRRCTVSAYSGDRGHIGSSLGALACGHCRGSGSWWHRRGANYGKELRHEIHQLSMGAANLHDFLG